jgi:hypothetical protein
VKRRAPKGGGEWSRVTAPYYAVQYKEERPKVVPTQLNARPLRSAGNNWIFITVHTFPLCVFPPGFIRR